ncbi:MAG: prepilin-type N-terminal cleavage/methylation domain-containing protein [Verrucomicrobia bacterium]|nr:prepilin-type N-terminal cleavage/methylation domain-containing protein [Verrucomicrobiota bacterium]MCH8512761.1 prepilin-type N-terminal cleavage/methylation domain-containing protein [Kiritimatiellia bacterium]
MKRPVNRPVKSQGFTLLEVLLALLILGMMSLMIFGSFQSVVETTTHAERAMESLHHGEVVMEQLIGSLRSASFFDSNPSVYTFQHERGIGTPPDDMLSWVTGTMSFLPPRYPTRQGMNRLFLSIEEIDGVRGLAISAYPHLVDPDDILVAQVEPWMISPKVKGLQVRFYDMTAEEWVDEWEDERQIPQFVEVTLFMEPLEERGPYRELVRRVEVPVGRISRETRRGRRPRDDQGEPAPTGAQPGAPGGAQPRAPGPGGGRDRRQGNEPRMEIAPDRGTGGRR